jgi:outer membrane protein OmpA-like peptidoglycan-associated protein
VVNNGNRDEPISPVITRRTPTDTTNRAGSKGPKTMFGVSKEDLVAGLTVPIEDVEFEANSAALLASTTQYLDELEAFLRENPNVIVEIGGHTNGLADKAYADELSSQRARAVVDYLKTNSVSPIQLRYRGYGKRYPVASDSTPQGRKKNQRVEVKIVAIIKQ